MQEQQIEDGSKWKSGQLMVMALLIEDVDNGSENGKSGKLMAFYNVASGY